MKAVICPRFGPPDVLQIEEVDKPVPKDNEILIKIHATTVTIGDTIIRRGKHPDSRFYSIMMHLMFGFRKPRRQVLGMEISGKIESVGSKVTRFKTGDKVFASTFSHKFGGHAEYKCLPEDGILAIKPEDVSFEEAAAIPGGAVTALVILRKTKISKGQKVLIYGASGAVGTNAVQLARHFGAHVTGICSGANANLIISLGAESVIDYTKEDFTQNGQTYDIIFDAVGKLSKSKCKKSLNKSGIYLNVLKDSGIKENADDLKFIIKLVEEGKLKPVIDRTYTLDQLVEAHRYVEQGHKKGNVSITINND